MSSNDDMPARLLDRVAAAHYLSASVDTIDRLIHAGALPVVRLPAERARNGRGRAGGCRRVLIDRDDLDSLIENAKASTEAAPAAPPLALRPARRRA